MIKKDLINVCWLWQWHKYIKKMSSIFTEANATASATPATTTATTSTTTKLCKPMDS